MLVSAAPQGFLLARLGWGARITLWIAALEFAVHVCGADVTYLAAAVVLAGVVFALQWGARRRDQALGPTAVITRS